MRKLTLTSLVLFNFTRLVDLVLLAKGNSRHKYISWSQHCWVEVLYSGWPKNWIPIFSCSVIRKPKWTTTLTVLSQYLLHIFWLHKTALIVARSHRRTGSPLKFFVIQIIYILPNNLIFPILSLLRESLWYFLHCKLEIFHVFGVIQVISSKI